MGSSIRAGGPHSVAVNHHIAVWLKNKNEVSELPSCLASQHDDSSRRADEQLAIVLQYEGAVTTLAPELNTLLKDSDEQLAGAFRSSRNAKGRRIDDLAVDEGVFFIDAMVVL
ncbi:hypothetical protein MA16_Dca022839 [Dendrobium catenatum]|uniref:Uncharacterized protein n=1 Tax=Dendrobium catenatum TaxID=906689 RepID=A0A2I0X0A3_9ASPA|nr:hypothetical protein MA16_Dca022839 [Dendrobium catenatum]